MSFAAADECTRFGCNDPVVLGAFAVGLVLFVVAVTVAVSLRRRRRDEE